ncbi:hypothetical protein EJ06DRAFT_533374 [Trichodelitschia bisporula]|uniref:60S ribosomal subunit assembly/export protein LOC1 n=1 Tax=Trichodelitschia bisporula TaxID=703511 RepID=A0A6G1HMQ9_9PEZI|nr:hypothetical protein EJ06DRAFT_533374 [Trichodelitschia bisporula]
MAPRGGGSSRGGSSRGGSSRGGKSGSSRGGSSGSSRGGSSGSSRGGSSGSSSSRVSKSKKPGKPSTATPFKTKRPTLVQKKKKRVYTEEELGIPKLNMITPAGVVQPKGQKKGKVFVDDQESMMTILAMVNAEKEGQIESKMMKARQMEAIREARHNEAEARQAERKNKLEDVKDSLRKKNKKKLNAEISTIAKEESAKPAKPKKRVSFG